MMLDVTQKHIDEGSVSYPTAESWRCRCPVARALREAGFPDAEAWVLYIEPEGRRGRQVPMPRLLCQFIKDFDAGFPVKPCRFNIPGLVRP